jgi:hypothetical protein
LTKGVGPNEDQKGPNQVDGTNQDFLTLWKDADPDIPIFIAAKAEYARLK